MRVAARGERAPDCGDLSGEEPGLEGRVDSQKRRLRVA
jgi:hypothetical protein